MEPWLAVGGGVRKAAKGPGSSRVPCRNFARGSCRWGQNCWFSHDRKSTQICRYFQNGFCGYGDRCSFQHVSETPVLNRCGSDSTFRENSLSLNRRGSEPAILPDISGQSWGGARRGSEPAVSSMTQLQMNFGNMRMSFDEEDEHEEVLAPGHPPNWALSREFVPQQTIPGSRSNEHRPEASCLAPENASVKDCPFSLVQEESTAAGGSGAAAAAVVEDCEDMVCGICMDKISEKTLPEERLFGILPNCTHAYCVGCIRKWRKSRDFQNAVIKACPECRITSSYYIPNKYWVSDTEEKQKLIETFKARTGKIRCKFFVRSNGHCPFKSECIYRHDLPGGQAPTTRRKRPVQRKQRPVYFDLTPSDSSDEDDDDDMHFFKWALTFALLHEDFDYSDYFLWDTSDSD